jgi:hypothetical protein
MPKWPPLRGRYSSTELPHSTDKGSQIARASRAEVPDLLSSADAANVAEMADVVAEVNGNID